MMKITLLLTIMYLILSCNTHKKDDNEIIMLTSQIIWDTINSKRINKEPIIILDSIVNNKYVDEYELKSLNIFSDNDIKSMNEQNERVIYFDFDKLTQKGFVIKNEKELMENTNYKFFTLSKPLYSNDDAKALVNVDFICYDCGHGHVFIMTKVNGNWQLLKIIDTWIN